MNTTKQSTGSESPLGSPWVYMLRGWVMFLLGSALVVMTAIKPHVTMLSKDFSWLPVIALLLITMGILRCLDSLMSRRSTRFQYNLQGGLFDLVVGLLILFNVGEDPVLLGLLISGYLITQALSRIILSFVNSFRNPSSTRVAGLLSLILGLMVWMHWPFPSAWFMSLSLSVEIASRGWALIQLAGALKDQST